MSYQFDIEIGSEDEAVTGNYNSRTVVVGGGNVRYVKDASAPRRQKQSPQKIAEFVDDELIEVSRERLRPVSLPIENRKTLVPVKEEEKINYTFTKIPWQLPKTPIQPRVVDVPKIDVVLPTARLSGFGTIINSDEPAFTLVDKQREQRGPKGPYVRAPIQGGGDRKNTRLCQFVKFDAKGIDVLENKCKNSSCNFAHSMNDYNPPVCIYQASCKNGNTCKFFHNKVETKDGYYLRSIQLPQEPRFVRK